MNNFDPESINFASLPYVDLCDRHFLPEVAGVYFVISESGFIRYIGRAKNLNQAWKGNIYYKFSESDEIAKIGVYYLVLDESLIEEVEKALISRFRPPLNRVLSSGEQEDSEINLHVTLNYQTAEILDNYCRETGIDRSNVIRWLISELPNRGITSSPIETKEKPGEGDRT